MITEKLYITPELKRKKKIYKFYFILSVFITNPFDISSVKSDNLFGEISDNTDEIAASIKANMIRNLNSFRLFVSL